MIKKLPTGARKFAVIAVISALCAVWTGLDSIRYYFSHKSCTERVTAHAEHVEMSLDKSGYTYTVDYTYEFGGSDHSFEAVFITKAVINITDIRRIGRNILSAAYGYAVRIIFSDYRTVHTCKFYYQISTSIYAAIAATCGLKSAGNLKALPLNHQKLRF